MCHSRGCLLALVLAASACAPSTGWAKDLAEYARYELREVTPPKKTNPEAMDKIKAGIQERLAEAVARWNQAGAQPGHAGTVGIEIAITELRYVSAKKRNRWGKGPGESHAGAQVRLIDVESGRTLHSQRFWEQANTLTQVIGEGPDGDAAMLDRFVTKIAKWVIAVYGHKDGLQSTSAATSATN